MNDEARLDFGYNWLPLGLSNKLHNSLVSLKIIPKELLSQKIVKIKHLDDICILTFIYDGYLLSDYAIPLHSLIATRMCLKDEVYNFFRLIKQAEEYMNTEKNKHKKQKLINKENKQ